MKPRRLAIVTQDPANFGGVLRLVEYAYRRAKAAGFEPTIIHYARFAEHPELSASLANIFRGELNFLPKVQRYEFRGMQSVAIGAYLPEWEPNRIHANRFWRNELAEFDDFLLVTGSAHTGLPLASLKKPFVAWVSSSVTADRGERLRSSRNFLALIERLGMLPVLKSEARVLNQATSILAVSNDARDQLRRLSNTPTEVWPFPIDTDRFQPSELRDSHPRFLFVGRANDPRKRVALFADACNELHRTTPDLEFAATIVSSVAAGFPRPSDTNLEVRSGISDSELIEMYSSSTALVLTSEQEGLGIAAMEAMACGLPVISTRCGGPETFIEDTISGFFVSNDPRKIAEAMHTLALNSALRERMGRAARERIEREFSERAWNLRFEKMLSDLPHS
ncbi:MAG: glycosyltransferase family 4 protein [Bacteroidota bacterium]|nr:glycosyltransferase family 4 protein [Bacteroidota bacterium]MDP4234200.1 glycosyltransferase family 4 protein [Bacteroidota bacterium]MDP4243734.1 glycosyltransferase family 4 protein [Bacteroidota bacterium]MDP4287901.1 glycosyltransferase family 4 protein [Bacteroidota bacterium]